MIKGPRRRISEFVNVTDYVANGSFAALKENVTYRNEPDYAILVRLVDHKSKWAGPFVYVDRASFDFLRKSALEPGDVVISNVGANAGTVFRAPNLGRPMTLGPNSVVLKGIAVPRYWYFFFCSPQGQAVFQSIVSGSAQPKFNKTDLRACLVPYPRETYQDKVASTLGALDDKIELNRRMNETLEAMARAIFKDWFVDFGPTRAKAEGRAPYLAPEVWDLFPNALDDEDKPVGWQNDVLGSFTNLQNGYAFKSKDWRDFGVPVVKIGSVKPAFVDLGKVSFVDEALAMEKANFRLSTGNMLVGLTGYVGETGRIPPTKYTPMLNQRVGRFLPNPGLEPFVFSCVRRPDFKEFAESKSHGSAQANVSTKDLLAYPLPNPGELTIETFCDIASSFFKNSLANSGQTSSLAQTPRPAAS